MSIRFLIYHNPCLGIYSIHVAIILGVVGILEIYYGSIAEIGTNIKTLCTSYMYNTLALITSLFGEGSSVKTVLG